MDERNFLFMFYGFAAVWAILAGYVIFLGTREKKLARQLENIRDMIANAEKS